MQKVFPKVDYWSIFSQDNVYSTIKTVIICGFKMKIIWKETNLSQTLCEESEDQNI